MPFGRLTRRLHPSAPEPTAPPDNPLNAIHQQVRAIELLARKRLSEPVVGEFRSAFRGQGVEFADLRAYVPGDDVRFIDWKVTARRGAAYVRRYEEERERTVLLIVDRSPSTAFGTTGRSLGAFAVEVAGLLGYAGALANDRVGAVAFDHAVSYTAPPRKGPRHVLRVIRDLLALPTHDGGTDLTGALEVTGRLARRRAAIFICSDFHADGWDAALKRLATRHDIVALVLRDPHEATLPRGGLVAVGDAESGATALLDGDAAAPHLARHAAAADRALRDRIRATGADTLTLTAGTDYLPQLIALFRARATRR